MSLPAGKVLYNKDVPPKNPQIGDEVTIHARVIGITHPLGRTHLDLIALGPEDDSLLTPAFSLDARQTSRIETPEQMIDRLNIG